MSQRRHQKRTKGRLADYSCTWVASDMMNSLDLIRVGDEAYRGDVVRHLLPEVLPPHLPENQRWDCLHKQHVVNASHVLTSLGPAGQHSLAGFCQAKAAASSRGCFRDASLQ